MITPVAFFCFNRPFHTYKTIKSLALNDEAIKTDLIAFVDGARKQSDQILINSVEKILLSNAIFFKSITINKSPVNLSSALNIRNGVSKILSNYESVIVLEDDIEVSKYFLAFMNEGLQRYKDMKNVWHINGYNFPINIYGNEECYFSRLMQCWGWATWRDRWDQFIEEPLMNDTNYIFSIFTKQMRKELDLNCKNSFFWSQVTANHFNKISTWAIFWYCFIFINKGLCLTPFKSLTKNIGFDNSGVNCRQDIFPNKDVNDLKILKFPTEMYENKKCLEKTAAYLDSRYNLVRRLNLKFRSILKNFKSF